MCLAPILNPLHWVTVLRAMTAVNLPLTRTVLSKYPAPWIMKPIQPMTLPWMWVMAHTHPLTVFRWPWPTSMKHRPAPPQWRPAVLLKTSVSAQPLPPSTPPTLNRTASVIRFLERAATNSVSPVMGWSPPLARSIMKRYPATTWRLRWVMATAAPHKTSPLPSRTCRFQALRPQ